MSLMEYSYCESMSMKSAFEHSCACVHNSQELATAQQDAFRACGSSHLSLKTWIISTLMSR